MKNRISLKKEFYKEIESPDMPPCDFIKQAVIDEPSLREKDDYFFVGDDIYIYLKTALFIIGRFAITNTAPLIKSIEHLAMPDKKSFLPYNDEALPGLDETEQDWNDKMLPILKTNAKYLGIDYNDLLILIYSSMKVNFPYYTGLYLDEVGLPGETRVSKFRVVTTNKELRIRFEAAHSRVMDQIARGVLDITKERERARNTA